MPRRRWFDLSANYRKRLARGGLSERTYESGAPLRAARGHARTPEHPGQSRQRPEFQQYYQQRQPEPQVEVIYAYPPTPGAHSDEVKQALAERIYGTFGDRHKFRGAHDPDFPPLGYPPAPDDDAILEALELDDGELEYLAVNDPEYWFLWYH